jgi:hypothetical protein
MPQFIEIPKDREVVEAYQFDGTLESAKTIVDWVKSVHKYGYLTYSASLPLELYVNNYATIGGSARIEVKPYSYVVFRDGICSVVPRREFESRYEPHPQPEPQPQNEEESDNNFHKLMTAIDDITTEQLIALGIIESDPRLLQLLEQVEELLDGIDCKEDEVGCHGYGGWWQTEDGAKFGNIKLHELKKLIQKHWTKSNTTES